MTAQCGGCEATGDFAKSGDKAFCPACCPQLYCQACLSATGGQCREHQEPECTCYEVTGGGHQMGCPFYRCGPPRVDPDNFLIEVAGVRIDPKDAVEEAEYTFTVKDGVRHPPLVVHMPGEPASVAVVGETRDEEMDEVGRIYDTIDEMMRGDDFDKVGDILDRIDMERSTLILLAYASITSAAQPILGERRTKYVARVRARLTETEPGRVDELLDGLE